jgi:phenylalanyl-tRNA synthetase alpha chain
MLSDLIFRDLVPERIPEIVKELRSLVSALKSFEELEVERRRWLSKDGIFKGLFNELREVSAEEKPKFAELLNHLRATFEKALEEKILGLKEDKLKRELEEQFFDLSLPASASHLVSSSCGSVHPIRQVERKIMALLEPFGFKIVHGPEIESDFYCFDALNIPSHHPARDMQDTFYTEFDRVLRTHTTSVQSRVLEKEKPPIKVASFGRVYRNENEDASHQAMFHQFELIWLEEGLTVAKLLGLITHILKGLYGQKRKIRFVPKYYPYTEPSIGPQIGCTICNAQGCSACGGAGWVTIAGSGMIHRNVLKQFGFDTKKISGFAFGLGTSRLVGQFYNYKTMREVYSNDLRKLSPKREVFG